MNLRNKNVLVSQAKLYNYSGSEIVTLELAQEFSRLGANVIVLTNGWGGEIEKDFRNTKNVKLLRFCSPEATDFFKNNKIDLAWIHHQLIPFEILREPGGIKFIFNHMSGFMNLEFPFFFEIEKGLTDLSLYNSPETLTNQREGGFNLSSRKIDIFPNPAPKKFFKKPNQAKRLKRVLIVSNHPPQEILDAAKILKKKGVEVVYRGILENKKPSLIKPEDIFSTDVVITIGKTVQYSIVSGTPVYCYDRFGGPGYLNNKNYEDVKFRNFSGRSKPEIKKSSEEIAQEILDGYTEAVEFSKEIYEKERDAFSLEKNIAKILDRINSENQTKRISKRDLTVYEFIAPIIYAEKGRPAGSLNYEQMEELMRNKDEELRILHEHNRQMQEHINHLDKLLNSSLKCRIKNGIERIVRR